MLVLVGNLKRRLVLIGPVMNLSGEIKRKGVRYLTDAQLLAAVLDNGSNGARCSQLPEEIIEAAGGIEGLTEITFKELCEINGVGLSGASAVMAAIELGRRALSGILPGKKLGSSSEVYDTFWPMLANERIEVFNCALVNSKLRLIKTEVVSKGILNASIVHPREAFRSAIRNSASGVIFVHNHPSGDAGPSEDDKAITDRLAKAGTIIGIPLLDHVIIGTAGAYYSFADAGEIPVPDTKYRSIAFE